MFYICMLLHSTSVATIYFYCKVFLKKSRYKFYKECDLKSIYPTTISYYREHVYSFNRYINTYAGVISTDSVTLHHNYSLHRN